MKSLDIGVRMNQDKESRNKTGLERARRHRVEHPDIVNRPDHYCRGRTIEPIEVVDDWELGFNLGNVVKYVARAGRKGDRLLDLQKAQYYLSREITEAVRDEAGAEEGGEDRWHISG